MESAAKLEVDVTELFTFQIHNTDGKARRSTFQTPHGPVEMPAFAPVGTAANVKTLEPRDLKELDVSILLANTYHLYLRPGHHLIERMGDCTALWAGTARY